MSRVIFKDPTLQAAFEKDGYARISLLLPEDIEELKSLFSHYFPKPESGFFSSSYLNDFDLKKEISNRLAEVIRNRAENHFKDYRIFGAAFLAKFPGPASIMPPHSDWTIVDEEEHVAVNIWTPLVDTTSQNGGLQVLPGSHNFARILRAPSLPYYWAGYEPAIIENITQLEVKAGEAIVINQAVVHASPPNLSNELRLAVTTGLMPAKAPMYFYYQAPNAKVEKFAMDDEFLLRFKDFMKDIYERPYFGENLGEIDYVHPNKSKEEVLAFIRAAGPGKGKNAEGETGFWGKIKRWMGN